MNFSELFAWVDGVKEWANEVDHWADGVSMYTWGVHPFWWTGGIAVPVVLFYVGLVVGLCFLQLQLARSKNDYLGWIVPAISFLHSFHIMWVCGVLFASQAALYGTIGLIVANVPTALYIVLYRNARKKVTA